MSREDPMAGPSRSSHQSRQEDHTQGGKMCFAKALLNVMDSSQNGFFVYCKYLDLFFLSDFEWDETRANQKPYLKKTKACESQLLVLA